MRTTSDVTNVAFEPGDVSLGHFPRPFREVAGASPSLAVPALVRHRTAIRRQRIATRGK